MDVNFSTFECYVTKNYLTGVCTQSALINVDGMLRNSLRNNLPIFRVFAHIPPSQLLHSSDRPPGPVPMVVLLGWN